MKLKLFRPGMETILTTDKLMTVDKDGDSIILHFEDISVVLEVSPIEMDLLIKELKGK